MSTSQGHRRRIKLAFLIRALDCGGTERQLVSLAKALCRRGFEVTIFTFYGGGLFEKELEGTGVRCVSLEKRGRWDVFGFVGRFARRLRDTRPDVVHAYLDLSNLLSLGAKLFSPRTPVIWGARSSDIELGHYDWPRQVGPRLERLFSRFPDRVIVNSGAGRAHLLRQGFRAEKVSLVRNGIDTRLFRPDAEARARVRGEWGVREDETLVGVVARLDPIKGHQTLLRAVSLLGGERGGARFVCVGGGAENYARSLYRQTAELGLTEVVNWAGMRPDLPAVYNALDINVSASHSEGFPNAVGEAMSCAVPCVVTDAGDSALVVGDTGFVSPAGNPEALAAALRRCLGAGRRDLGARARRRIMENWSLERLVEETEKVIMAVAGK